MASNTLIGSVDPQSLAPGPHLIDGLALQILTADGNATQSGLTAKAGGGAALAVQLKLGMNEIAVCATTSDSAILPLALAGAQVFVVNNGAQTCAIYPQQSNPNNVASAADTLVPIGGSTASTTAVPANSIVYWYCYKPGFWKTTV